MCCMEIWMDTYTIVTAGKILATFTYLVLKELLVIPVHVTEHYSKQSNTNLTSIC